MEEQEDQVPGASWKNVAYRMTFEEADAVRVEKLLEEGMQAKVKWMPSMDKFAVKARRDPLVVATEKLARKNNKKGNKKRGKNL